MSCIRIDNAIKEFALHFPEEGVESVANILGLWWDANPERYNELPSDSEFREYVSSLRASSQEALQWARQNPELIQELREKSAGKVLTDKFANTRVSQARALAEILSKDSSSPSEDQQLPMASLEEIEAVERVFDPMMRRDRVSLIARFFSDEVSSALKEKQDIINKKMMEEQLTEAQKNQLRQELYSLDRFGIIKSLTPGGVFNRVRAIFEEYLKDSEEGRIQAELNKINASEQALIDEGVIDESERFSDEEKLEAAKKRAIYKKQEYQKLVKYFRPLAEEASAMLVMTEGIRVDPSYMSPDDANLNDDDPEGNSEIDNAADDSSKEESYKDGWMTNFKHVSSHESLSQAVRKIIREIPKLDHEGMIEEDDLGNTRYLDADYVHATLIDKLRYMITSEDMVPLLEDLAKLKPWVEQVIETLDDDTIFSQFYQDFRKDYTEYWIQKKVNNPDGTFKIETISVNKPEGVYYILDSWRDNYESGTLLDNDSIYEKNGEVNKENAAKGLKMVEELNNQFIKLSTQERLDLLEENDVWDKVIKLLNMVGIDPNPGVLRVALTNIKEVPGIDFTDPIMLLIPQLNIIFKGVKDGKVKSKVLEDGTVKRGDLINTFGTAYNEIASIMAEVTEDAIESSVRENDKTHYSHVNPSYLGKLIKQLKNVMNRSKEEYDKFIETEFKQYEWFFKDGRWRNDWIREIVEDPSMRKALQHKVVLNHDKIAYQNWDDLDYTIVLLNEYLAEPKEKMAWYHVPILSDSPSAEFIRFKRFTNGSEQDEDGNDLTFQESIVSRMIDIVNQEYDRIMLVKERGDRFSNNDPNIEPIANFDMTWDKNGEVKNPGGAEFKFIPELNNYTYENGETFLNRFERLRKESPSEFEQFLRDTLTDIMEAGFEKAYEEWASIGLLDELPNGKFKNIPFQGQSAQNQRVATSLRLAQEKLGGLFTSEMRILLDRFVKNKTINDKQANEVFGQIEAILSDKVNRGELTGQEMRNITMNLTTKNNSKDALREYYWNSKFATSQIIQLTTTDLAFYKNLEDFQKRYKEVHAPSLRLNTMAKFNGETIGRKWERTIYLADNEIVSSIAKDVEEIFLKKLKDGELTEYEAASVISKYGLHNVEINDKKYYKVGDTMVETSYINVADAQAYRSLSSYRAMMGMMGQWTDEMETAYKHLTDPKGGWTMDDFNIIWQPKKPYVYTQINNDSGVEGHTGIKTPVQHKNSEFLLLAIYDAVSGPLGKSGKLKAINDFMEKHQIDVVQFESTTKVGKQGVIDLNDKAVMAEQNLLKKEGKPHTIQDAVASILGKTTSISYGTENPNVVHKVSYEDYGIQTATPEHAIDAVQLVGTQIRKLITADIADDAQITVDGKTMTKAEWIKLYNAINTENILQSFKEVNEIFQDPKEVEKILQEEIRGNARYGMDMLKACTLNKDGEFNIPLYDPVQSQRVQTLINSIIKSRITKQKIRGGALIQVSAYGLTDQLKIVYEGEGDNKRIKYLECYMPAYSRQFYEPLMGEDGQLNVNDLPPELRKLIGYRVPTEDKYSMAPLFIKGFLPQQNGSAIMLPAEITTLSGSDFDVDKMYIMLPEFEVVKQIDWKSLENSILSNPGFKKWGRDKVKMTLEMIQSNMITFEDGSPEEAIFDYYSSVKESLTKTVIRKLNYDYSKPAHEQKSYRGDNGLARRNNALIDMMWGILTNSDTTSKILNPGGFDKQKAAARVVTILDSMTLEELKEEKLTPEKLLELPLETLNKLAGKYKKNLDPLSPRTQVILHQQNMTGGKMIGIYANHNANHALMQHTELGVDTKNGSFNFAGVRRTSLHSMKNERGEFISRNNANFLAASVDNVKDNTLHATNQNTFTGDASMLLSRLGYTPTEIAILMRQPIVMAITSKYFRESRDGKGKDVIMSEVISDTAKLAGMYENISYDNVKNNPFDLVPMMEDIMSYKTVNTMSQQDKINFYRRQVTVGLLFQRIMKTADALGDLVQATRADTQGGAAGPTIADSMNKLQKVDDLIKNIIINDKFPLTGAGVISSGLRYTGDIDSLRERLLSSPLPFLQAFYTLGLEQTENMLGKYFPQFSNPFREVLEGKYDAEGNAIFEGFRSMTKTGKLDVKTINSIYNDLLAYIMSGIDFFGGGLNRNGQYETSLSKRRKFINNFPAHFNQVIKDNEDIADLEFLQRLKFVRANDKNPVDIIVFKNVGRLSPILRERYMRDWASLLYMEKPEAHRLALDLFLYSYFRNGFAFGPSTFIHLAPIAVRYAVPEYISTLRSLIPGSKGYAPSDFGKFVYQYIYNHLDNRKFVPSIPDTASTRFIEGEKENLRVKDEVVISITDSSTYGDKTAIKKSDKVEGNTMYTFFDFIHKRIKGKDYYYRLTDLEGDNTAIYTRIEPLGFKHNFLEYEYGKDVLEMETVIDKNKKNYNPDSENDAQHSDVPLTDDTSDSTSNYSEINLEGVTPASAAYERVYGESLQAPTDETDITSIEPNEGFRDANDEELCRGF